ncbi:MAG: FprA family A-type flavoprotein [Bacteroidales bacterium]|jgi:flavorubredoxin|nr:FprA family A-type flavoprotein [Bacteroidales bacterium]
MADNKTIQVSPKTTWIGVLDKEIVTFDVVMETKYGTTYNSYFINADKKTVVETVKEKFWPVYKEKLSKLTALNEIEYIILNHTEPDHSGSVELLLNEAPNATVIGTGNAIRYMKDLMNRDFPHRIVKDGDVLDLGDATLKFISAPNLHWPDSMYTWYEEEQLLFTCDSFGAHFAHDDMIDNKVGNYDDAFDYYFDVILKPYSKFFLKAIEKIEQLPIKAILNGHGPLLLNDWKRYVDRSRSMSEAYLKNPDAKTILVAYVSAYQKTAMIAKEIARGIESESNVKAHLMDIETATLGDMDAAITAASGLVLGSPTINQNILLPAYKFLAAICPIRDKGKPAGAFGSYGWSGESAVLLKPMMENLKLDFCGDGVFVKFTPGNEELTLAFKYGKVLAEKVLERDAASN